MKTFEEDSIAVIQEDSKERAAEIRASIPVPSSKGLVREVSNKALRPSQHKCNAKLLKRDGYCDKAGTNEYERCLYHPADTMYRKAKELYKDALPAYKTPRPSPKPCRWWRRPSFAEPRRPFLKRARIRKQSRS